MMALALDCANQSNSEKKKVGAVIVANSGKVYIGYNKVYRKTEGKETCALHAETMAIMKAGEDARHGTLYTTHYPCDYCAAMIVQSTIDKVVYIFDNPSDYNFPLDLYTKVVKG